MSATISRPATSLATRVPRCEFTQLTKPECHCPSCLATLVASHAPDAPGGIPTPIRLLAPSARAMPLEAA